MSDSTTPPNDDRSIKPSHSLSDASPENKSSNGLHKGVVTSKWGVIFACLLVSVVPFYWRFADWILALYNNPNAVTNGVWGDQAFYLWALERAKHASSYRDFIINCQWNADGCFVLESFPQEWPALYTIGKIGAFLDFSAITTMNTWYVTAVVLNTLCSGMFLLQLTKNPLLSFTFALSAVTQLSLIVRLGGHFSLVSIWPSFLFLTIFSKILELIFSEKKSITGAFNKIQFNRYWPFFALAPVVFLITQSSFYYFAFSAILALMYLLVTAVSHYNRVTLLLSRRFFILLLPSIASLVIGLWIVKFSFLPDLRYADQATFKRSAADVVKFSAKWVDFVNPVGHTPVMKLIFDWTGFTFKTSQFEGREEICSYLGTTVWFLVFSTFVVCVVSGPTSLRKYNAQFNCVLSRRLRLLGVMSVIALYLTTAGGGRLINLIFSGLRCFNRMAPFAVIFVVALCITICSKLKYSRQISGFLILGALLIQFFEFAWIKPPHFVKDGTRFVNGAQELKKLCSNKSLRLVPAVPNFLYGPYDAYFVAEMAKCRILNIGGPGFQAHTGPDVISNNVDGELDVLINSDHVPFIHSVQSPTGVPLISFAEDDKK